MQKPTRPLAPLFLLLLTAPLSAQSPQPTTLPSLTDIDAAVKNLASPDFPTREAADKKLRLTPWPAIPTLMTAARTTKDPEAISRINAIIRDTIWDTTGLSETSTQAVRAYLAADPVRGEEILHSFSLNDELTYLAYRNDLILGKRELRLAQSMRETDSLAFLNHIDDMQRASRWDELEWDLLVRSRIPHLLVSVERRGTAEPLLRDLKALNALHFHFQDPTAPIKVAVARAAGDTGQALALARAVNLDHPLHQLLAERQDWAALSQFPVEHDFFNVSRFIPASALLFSGKTAEADALIAKNSKAANGVEPVSLQRQLVMLGRTELINQACIERGDTDTLVDFLLRERRYNQALLHHSTSAPATRQGKDAWTGGTIIGGGVIALGPAQSIDAQLDARLVLALVRLNEPARARSEIDRLDKIGTASYFLNQASLQLGDDDAIARRLNREPDRGSRVGFDIFQLFGEHALAPLADALALDIKNPDEVFRILKRMQRDQASIEEIQQALASAKKPRNIRDRSSVYGDNVLLAAAIRFDKIGRNDLALQCITEYASAQPDARSLPSARRAFENLAPFASDIILVPKSQLPRQFLDAISARPDCDPTLLYLAGNFNVNAGNADLGQKQIRDAEHLIGGDMARRLFLAQTLKSLGQTESARAMAQRIVVLDAPASDTRFKAHCLLADIAREQQKFADALFQYRLAFYAEMYDYISIGPDDADFYQAAMNTAYCLSRLALEQNDLPTALRSAADLIALDPENLSQLSPLINAFQTANHPAEAQTLSASLRTLYESTLKDFPNSHLHHFLLAKLAADTHTTSPDSTAHLTRARQLAPNNPDYQNLAPPAK